MAIEPAIPAASMTLEDINAIVATNEIEEREDREAELEARRARAAAQRKQEQTVAAARIELASDLGTSSAFLQTALDMRSGGHTRVDRVSEPLWWALGSLNGHVPDVDMTAVLEARHALAAESSLPAVRRDDKVFGGDVAKRMRQLPSVPPRPIGVGDVWCETVCKLHGLSYDRHPSPIDLEPDRVARERVFKLRDSGKYDPKDSHRNNEIAYRELELLEHKRKELVDQAVGERRRSTAEFRAKLLSVVDSTIAKLDLGLAWWWAMQLRRHVAGERARITDFDRVLATTSALGVRFPFETLQPKVK